MASDLEKRVNFELFLITIGAALFGYNAGGADGAMLAGSVAFFTAARGTRWVQLAGSDFKSTGECSKSADMKSIVDRTAVPDRPNDALAEHASPKTITHPAGSGGDDAPSTNFPENVWMGLGMGICMVRGKLVDDYLDDLNLSREERATIVNAIKMRCAWTIATSDMLRGRTDGRDTVCMLLNLSYLERPISPSRNPYGEGTLENPYPVNSAEEAADWLRAAWPKSPTIEEPVAGKAAHVHTFKVVLGPNQYGIFVSFRYVS